MGCWNKTCGLTNLPILYQDKVLVIPIVKNPLFHNFCGSTSLYSPILLPFYSSYDDYGGGTNSTGIMLDHVIDYLRSNLIEKTVGDNPVHDMAISKNDFGVEQFFESISENRLEIQTKKGSTPVNFVMFHNSIVDDIIQNHTYEEYTGNTDQPYSYKFSDIILDIPKLIDELFETKQKADQTLLEHLGSRYLFDIIQKQTTDLNLARDWLYIINDYSITNQIAMKQIMFYLNNGDYKSLTEFLTDLIKGFVLEDFVNSIRLTWIPSGHEGSQRCDYQPYQILMKSMQSLISKEEIQK